MPQVYFLNFAKYGRNIQKSGKKSPPSCCQKFTGINIKPAYPVCTFEKMLFKKRNSLHQFYSSHVTCNNHLLFCVTVHYVHVLVADRSRSALMCSSLLHTTSEKKQSVRTHHHPRLLHSKCFPLENNCRII